jgi:hypothetical protein
VVELVEGRARFAGAVDVAQVRKAADVREGERPHQAFGLVQRRQLAAGRADRADRRVEAVAGAAEPAEELHHLGVPAGDVVGQLLQQADGALAAAVTDRVGDVEPLAAGVEALHQPRAEQLGDVGDHPVVAGLDRLVLPQPVDALAQHRGGGADAIDHLAQGAVGAKLVGVEGAVDRREQVPELVGVVDLVVVAGGVAHDATVPLRTTWVVSFGTMK